jgi:ABC-type phosphate/phosphonate transport system substrate-binding protein
MVGKMLALAALVAAAGTAVPPPQCSAGGEEVKKPVQIGVTGSLFRDVPDSIVRPLMKPFNSLMEMQTGLSGEFVPGVKTEELLGRLKDGKLQLAVYQGFEYAWVREKHPNLKPLMIAVNEQKYLRASVVVRSDSKATRVADLQGKTITIPFRIRDHCKMFLDRCCQESGKDSKDFFAKTCKPLSPEEALDAVVLGDVDAALADAIALDWYKNNRERAFAKLKVLETSEVFPAAVIVYYDKALDEETLRRFREGMLSAKDNPRAVELMTLCQMTSFEPVPGDYEKVCRAIAKTYPPPDKKKEEKQEAKKRSE